MKTFLTAAFFSILLFAENPTIYSQLGDLIYDNAPSIEKLNEIDGFSSYSDDIKKYIADVQRTKKTGFDIESGNKDIDKKEYLKSLRELKKRDEHFVRVAKMKFEESLAKEDSKLFAEIINSGIIDLSEYKEEIFSYYEEHKQEITLSGELERVVQDELLRIQNQSKEAKSMAERQTQKNRIERIRAKYKAKEEAIDDQLEKETLEKKKEIIEYQKEELSGS